MPTNPRSLDLSIRSATAIIYAKIAVQFSFLDLAYYTLGRIPVASIAHLHIHGSFDALKFAFRPTFATLIVDHKKRWAGLS